MRGSPWFSSVLVLSSFGCREPAQAPLDASRPLSRTATQAASSTTGPTLSARGRLRIDLYSGEELDELAKADALLLMRIAPQVLRLSVDLAKHKKLFERSKTAVLSADDRDLALDLFGQVLAYQIALDTESKFHLEFYRIDPVLHPIRHARHFLLGFAAYCLQVRLGLELIAFTIGKPQFEELFDEGSPERGIPPRAYALLKWNVVHVEEVGRIFAAHQYHKVLGLTWYSKLDPPFAELRLQLDASYEAAKHHFSEKGVELFAANGLDLLKDGGHTAWFPVQAGVAEWMGDTRVHRQIDLIGDPLILGAIQKTQPGDVIVERRNWYISNIGLPGFWPHTALYLGSPTELASFFDGDPQVVAAFGGPFSHVLAKRYPKVWADYNSTEHEHPRRLIEAMSEGVLFTTAEHSFASDYAAAMRPRLAKVELAHAIDRAFGYEGRPYDFDFDFQTDRALVCSELVYKAYEPRKGITGLKLDLVRVVGRPTLPPNTMVEQFDREYGTPAQQLDFVWFLDGREKERKADWADCAALRESHRRPKWDLVQE